MVITIFGGTGKVGSLVVQKLLTDGHQVRLLVRTSTPFETNELVTVIKGNVHDATSIAMALQGSQAVISTLSSWHTPSKDILSAAMRAAIPVMQQNSITRIISLTGSGAHAPGDKITTADKVSHAVFGIIAKKIITDAETHLQLLADSNLQWTVVRSPVMRSSTESGYVLNASLPKAWETVTRTAVAQAIVDQLYDNKYYAQAPHIHQS